MPDETRKPNDCCNVESNLAVIERRPVKYGDGSDAGELVIVPGHGDGTFPSGENQLLERDDIQAPTARIFFSGHHEVDISELVHGAIEQHLFEVAVAIRILGGRHPAQIGRTDARPEGIGKLVLQISLLDEYLRGARAAARPGRHFSGR